MFKLISINKTIAIEGKGVLDSFHRLIVPKINDKKNSLRLIL